MVYAVVSDQPTCPAAASHVAASSIHPHPLSAHVPEVTTANAVVCGPAIVLHELLEASQNSPVVALEQSVVPHAQFARLIAMPFVLVQGSGLEHVLLTDEHTNPRPGGVGWQAAD